MLLRYDMELTMITKEDHNKRVCESNKDRLELAEHILPITNDSINIVTYSKDNKPVEYNMSRAINEG